MYTVIGYISASTGLITLICYLPGVFVEYRSPAFKVGQKDPPKVKPQGAAKVNHGFEANGHVKVGWDWEYIYL